jgi:sugar lactone lactonase YvrE
MEDSDMRSTDLGLVAVASLALFGCTPEPEPEATATQAPPPPPPAPAAAPTAAPADELPEVIVAERGGFIPEGVEYDQAGERFLTGSLAEGTVFEVAADGSLTPFVTDPELVSSVGIEVDEPRDRLLVANSDSAVFQGQTPGQAKLGVFSLTSGERLAMVDLAATLDDVPDDAAFFANDVAVADDGTIFVTDTQRNVLYEVDANYEASVFHRFEATEGMALNGLVHHEDGYLLVISLGNGNLYKVPVDDPEATSQVMLPEPVTGGDGAVWTADGQLAIVSNNSGRVVALESDDDWASAQIAAVAMYEGQATTAAVVGDDVYIVKPHFADQDPPSIERVMFN